MQSKQAAAFTILVAATLLATEAQAIEFDTGDSNVKLRWDNTIGYTSAFRVKDRSPGLASTAFGASGIVGPNNINQDDGDNNFGRGLVSSRWDLLSELDLSVGDFGGRVSAAAWYDPVYNRPTKNITTTSNNTPASAFPSDTKKIMGRDSEILDAFVFGKFAVGDKPVAFRAGRHTLLWGESLFFGANGIAGGQAPLDLVKLLSVPTSTFKEIVRPTGKVSGQIQLTSHVALGAYWSYEWEKTRLIPVGSYLSAIDTMGPGAQPMSAGTFGTFVHESDLNAKSGGQGGVQMRWRAEAIDTDFGAYAIRYHANQPSQILTTLNGHFAPESYRWVYHEGINAYGASFAKTIGDWAFAGEASYRTNTPLTSAGQTVIPAFGLGTSWNNNDNPGYAVGETAHAQLSWIASLGPSFISNEALLIGEVAWNTRVKVTKHPEMLDPLADKSAHAIRIVYSPSYRQVFPGVDMTPNFGLGYTWGGSSAVGPAFGPDRGGDLNIGVSAVYLGRWNFNLNYVHYLGQEGSTLDNANNVQFLQALKDRNFMTMSVRTTF